MSAVSGKPIGIVCPLKEEADSLLAACKIIKQERLNGCRSFKVECEGRQMWIIVSGVGKKKAAKATQSLIDCCQPTYLINFGTAGGSLPGIRVGEIVVSSQAIAYDCQLVACYQGDSFLIEQALTLPGVREGIIACADQNVDTPAQREYMWETYQAVCCDWESAAVLQVAQRNRVPAVALRVISDVGEQALSKEFRANLPKVITKGSRVLLEFITKI